MKSRKYWSSITVNFNFQCLPSLNFTFHRFYLVPILLFIFSYVPSCVPWNEFSGQSLSSCNRTRSLFTNTTWGVISDGKANYTQDSYCEFIIVADDPSHYITLLIEQVRTECSYDYLFVFDGESYARNTTLLASFSGASENSVTLMARSGKMLILLYSDTNYALEGFQSTFSITRCPLNCSSHGECVPNPENGTGGRHICMCAEGFSGEGCEIHNVDFDTLLIPSKTFPNVYHRVGHSAVKIEDKIYIFGGFDLNKIKDDLKIYDLLTGQLQDFKFDPSKFVNSSSADATKLDSNFKCDDDSNSDCQLESKPTLSDEVDDSENELKPLEQINFWPQARFGHASTAYKTGFFIHGGRLSDQNGITNELLYFNVTTMKWTKVGGKDGHSLPHLMYHTMTLTPSGHIYVYGGGSPSGSFSSKLYRFHGDHYLNTMWEEVHSTCCGKPKDRSLLGHTANYWEDQGYKALIIFGGVTVDIGRFSKISNQFWMYLLDDGVWLEIEYRRNQQLMHYKSTTISSISNTERAFHSMDIVGKYMVIIGGYTHAHNKDETCYSNQMLVYNLECHQFVPDLPIRISGLDQGLGHKLEGIFGHKTAVYGEKVFIIGGYRGYLDGRIRTIGIGKWLPYNGHKNKGDCNYYDKWRCSGDRLCGWCPTSEICYEKQAGSKNCTTNLQTSQCPGICPLISSCQACVTLKCSWCDFLDACFDTHDVHYTRQCNSLSTDYKSCVTAFDRQGASLFEYRHPPDFQNPDQVKLVNSTVFRLPREMTAGTDAGPTIMIMKGFLVGHIQNPRRIELCGSQARINLTLENESYLYNRQLGNINLSSGSSGIIDSAPATENLTTHLNWSVHLNCMNLSWPSGLPVVIQPDSRIRFDISANTSRASFDAPVRVILQQRMSVKNSSSIPATPYRISKESLIPYAGGINTTCLGYTSCLACVGDSSCTWKDWKCHSRLSSSQIDETMLRSSQVILTLDQCPVCSDLTTCTDCLSFPRLHSSEISSTATSENNPNSGCEWNEEESSCHRPGRVSSLRRTAVTQISSCPGGCHLRKNCSSCLEGPGKCVWCADRNECFVFDVYTSFYQYGQCVHWMDKSEQCQRCAKQSSCEDCIRYLGCGWRFGENGGSCTEGDYSGPFNLDDMVVMSSSSPDFNLKGVSAVDGSKNATILNPYIGSQFTGSGYAYASCPDINECLLGNHDCHENAVCVNTPGSYECACKQGYTGDGILACEETCYEPCVHGTCVNSGDLVNRRTKSFDDSETPSSSPAVHFMCECDLGFTGVTCSIDCGCNNHSSCETGNGCDFCQDWTTGSQCQNCVTGSFGDATSIGGCRPCICNGHGDVSRGICDETGKCACLNNTDGPNCQQCAPGYFGDPRNGKPCFKDCAGRAVMENDYGFFGINSRTLRHKHLKRKVFSFDELPLVEHCMWILKLNDSFGQGDKMSRKLVKPRQIKITISPNYNIPCSVNSLDIYSGLPSFTHPHRKSSVLIASVCSPYPVEMENSLNSANIVTGKPLEVFVEATMATIVLRSIVTNTSTIKFNATFEYLKEIDKDSINSTPSPSSMLSFTIGNSRIPATRLYDGHSVYSRFGHSLHADENNVWIFGGYSLSHGTLNDVRQFNRVTGKWEALTIDVNFVENEDSVPPARYFHAGCFFSKGGSNNENIVIHGGLTEKSHFLSDTWRFDTRVKRWSKIYGGRGDNGNSSLASLLKLAGHTLTRRRGSSGNSGSPHQNSHEYPELVLIGGFNTETGFSNRTFSLNLLKPGGSLEWEEVTTFDASPIGIYGHTTVYHEGTDSFYVFGGILFENGKVFVSQTLFSLNWATKKWSVLPSIEENQVTKLPVPKFFHSAVTTDAYMIVMGGSHGGQVNSKTEKNAPPSTSKDFALAYAYKCNLWTLLEGENALLDRTGGASSIWKEDVLLMGGWNWLKASTTESIFKLKLPSDICGVQDSSEKCKATVGCSYCFSNNNQSAQCYSADLDMPRECSLRPNGTELKIDFLGGTLCSRKWIESRNCNQFDSCTECLAAWPSHDDARTACQWCTNCVCPGGSCHKCIPVGKSCHEENSCSQKQRETLEVKHCPERQCSADDCEKCTASGKCVWTRQILRSTEYSWKLHSQPIFNWNCVRKQIVNTSTTSYKVIASPPELCPIPCVSHRTCEKCLSSMNDVDKRWFLECRWSIKKNLCYSPSHSHLLCFGGTCGPSLHGNSDLCPRPCSQFKSCSSCLQNPSCGWCADTEKNGVGHCLPGDSVQSQVTNCTSVSADISSAFASSVTWNYLKCPSENECLNSHHTCDEVSEKCIDLEESDSNKDGYRCECREGYRDEDGICVPICDEGCLNGTCVSPQVCECHFGYVGKNCEKQCDCNGHSNCAGVEDLKNCTQCKNDTMGPQCSKCKPLFVGDPRNGRPCISCFDYCNGHSHICLPPDSYFQFCAVDNYDANELLMKIRSNSSLIVEGSYGEASCCGCNDKTSGDKCEECIPGYFRGSEDKRRPCRRCECHGHAEPQTVNAGNCYCNCHNNTESDHCTQNPSKMSQCWKSQCAKCKEAYLGNPTNGHQCYRHMFVDSTLPINGLFENNSISCFDQKAQGVLEYCGNKPKPLLSGRTVYFAIQPKFMNVNIRFNLDVTVGAVHVYLSPKDDTFVIRPDNNTWMHKVEFDSKYGLNGERERDPNSNMIPENGKDADPTMTTMGNDEEGLNLSKGIGTGAFKVVEIEAASFVTHRTLEDPRAFLVVRNVRNRLVITLPQDYHDLRLTRFYIVLEGVGDKSFGSVSFRQDQLHIDLFVFFSVFFSAFFLFLAACGIAWKIKQNMETRRARHRHVAEMLSMAKRAFAVWTVILEPDQSSPLYQAYTQCRKTCRKGCICFRPLAIETTQDGSSGVCTMLVSLPGGSVAPVKLCLASCLAYTRSNQPIHARRRRR